MQFLSKDISELIQGDLLGDSELVITGFNGILEAEKGDLTYVESEKYLPNLENCNASLILIKDDLEISETNKSLFTFIKVANPRFALAQLLGHYKLATENYNGISKQASIDPTAEIGENTYLGNVTIDSGAVIGKNCQIHHGVVIGKNVSIGDHTVIHSGAKVLNDSMIGKSCTLQANCIIGSDGFGFVPNSENNYMKIHHVGNVILENHVEIGAGTTIDRATMGSTIIKTGVKLDNLIQIAHNVEIGENTVIAAQTGIAGSTKIGKNCMIGGQVGIIGHIQIADEVKIAAQSGIGHSIEEKGLIVQGSPAFGIRNYKMSYVGFRKLPELMKKIDSLQKQIDELKN